MALPGPIGVIKGVLKREAELADFIQNGPDDGLGGWVRDKYRDRCNQFANLPGWARALTRAAGGGMGRVCKPYWDDNGWDGPVNEPAVSGGQCAVSYQVFTTPTNSLGEVGAETFTGTFTGPFSLTVGAASPGECDPGFTRVGLIEFKDGSGTTILATGNGCRTSSKAYDFRFVRVDGQPDDCGDQEGEPEVGPNPPPDPGPLPGPEPTTDPRNPIGPPLLPIPPYNDPFGGPTPVVEPPGGDPDYPTPPTQPPGDVGEPGGEDTTGPGGDADGEAPTGKVLTGLRIRFVSPPVGGNEYAPGVFRGVCYVYMGTAEGLDHDPAGAMLRDGQFVYAEKDNLTRWAVSANQGYNLGVTPYYRDVEQE